MLLQNYHHHPTESKTEQTEAIMDQIQSTLQEIPIITTTFGQQTSDPWKGNNSMGGEEDYREFL